MLRRHRDEIAAGIEEGAAVALGQVLGTIDIFLRAALTESETRAVHEELFP